MFGEQMIKELLEWPVVILMLVHKRSHLPTIEVHPFNHVNQTEFVLVYIISALKVHLMLVTHWILILGAESNFLYSWAQPIGLGIFNREPPWFAVIVAILVSISKWPFFGSQNLPGIVVYLRRVFRPRDWVEIFHFLLFWGVFLGHIRGGVGMDHALNPLGRRIVWILKIHL